MATKRLTLFGDPAGTITADQAATPATIPYRDSFGGVSNTTDTAATQVSTSSVISSVAPTSTGTTTINAAANTTFTTWPCSASGGAFAITLPSATGTGLKLVVKKIDSSGNAVTVTGAGSDNIDGSNTHALSSQWNSIIIQDVAAGVWLILGKV